MSKLLKSATVVAGLTLAGAAFAGGPDHLAPPPHMPAWYFGAHIGPSFTTADVIGAGAPANLNVGFDVGGQLGYRWNPHMRAELQYSYWRHTPTATGRAGNFAPNVNYTYHTLMANVYYDANPIVYHIHPYFGVGLGWMNVYTGNAGGIATFLNNSVNEFAWQGIGGLSYHVMQNLSVFAEYRIVSWTNLSGFWNAVNAGANYYFSF